MSADLATLGLELDSRPIAQGSKDLDRLTQSAGKAERAATGFGDGAKKAQSATERMNEAVKRAERYALAAVGALTAVGGALAYMVRNQINAADAMSKLSQQVGINVRELSALKHAADLSGVSLDGIATSSGYLGRAMRDSAAGASNAATQALERLGISATDANGRLRSITDVMTDAADRFSRMQDGAEKSALAMDLFGRSGRQLIPMLNQGADGLRDMTDEAARLGLVLDNETAQAAEAYNDNLTRMGRAKDGLVIQLTAHMLPALENLTEKLVELVADGERVEEIAEALGNVFHWVAREAALVAGGIAGINAELAGLMEAGRRLGNLDFSGAIEAWNEGQQAAKDMREEWVRTVDEIMDGTRLSQGAINRRINRAFAASGESAGTDFSEGVEKGIARGSSGVARAAGNAAREAEREFARVAAEADRAVQAFFPDAARAADAERMLRYLEQYRDRLTDIQVAAMELEVERLFSGAGDAARQAANDIESTLGSVLADLFLKPRKDLEDLMDDLARPGVQITRDNISGAFEAPAKA